MSDRARGPTLQATTADWVQRGLLALGFGGMVVGLLLPLLALAERALTNAHGAFVGLRNFTEYLGNAALRASLLHSLWVASLATLIVVPLAFFAAYAVTRTRMPGRNLFRGVLFLPLLAPSLLSGLALVYWFGAQGPARGWLGGASVYGPMGIVLGSCFWTLPHAFLILVTAFAHADGRLYEAARVLGAGPLRVFLTVTLPSARYGIISSALVVFTLVFTDFGVPKVIGGPYNVLATDIYKQIIGQQNFAMGAAISLLLLLPAIPAFFAKRRAALSQNASLSGRAVAYQPKPAPLRDMLAAAYAGVLSLAILAVMGMALFASLVKLWPYNLSLTFAHYRFEAVPGSGLTAFANSLCMAIATGVAGAALVFIFAYLAEKGRGTPMLGAAFGFLAMLPLAIPGMVLGLAYIFFFNARGNPLGALYGTMPLLVICTLVHFYTVAHLTAAGAVNQLDHEFEAVSSMLRAPFWRLLRRVTVPVCGRAILDIAFYLFVNAMTTVSAVIFLYSPATTLASVAALNLDDSGETAASAAMACLIVAACAVVQAVHALLTLFLDRRQRRWQQH